MRDSASLTATAIGSIDNGAELDVQELKNITDGNTVYLFARAVLRSKTIRYTDTGKVSALGDTVWLAMRKTQGNSTDRFAEFSASASQTTPAFWQSKQRALAHSQVNIRGGDTAPEQTIGAIAVGSEVEYDPATAKQYAISGKQEGVQKSVSLAPRIS